MAGSGRLGTTLLFFVADRALCGTWSGELPGYTYCSAAISIFLVPVSSKPRRRFLSHFHFSAM